MLIPKTEDGRVLFAIPCQGRLLVGTTDDEIAVADELYLTKGEVEYLLRHLNRYLARPVARDQVVSGSAGARALVSARDAKDTRKLVRDHEVELNPGSGLLSILGGKWTTYRAMAEDTINAVQKYLGGAATGCVTADHQLAGSEGYTPGYWKNLVREFGVAERTARHLVDKFGARARDVIAMARQQPELSAPLMGGIALLRAEVVFAAREEMAVSIEDVLARRIGLELYGWKEALQAAPVVADLLAGELRWSESARRQALDQYVGRIRSLMERAGLVAPQN